MSKKNSIVSKTSIGIILCRKNNNKPEVLLVHKRFTYAFSAFVNGKYEFNDTYINSLLQQMTVEELMDIWSLNFEQLWYRVWLTRDKNEEYIRKFAKFQFNFLKDGGEKLKQRIQHTKSNGFLLWEIPKGRKELLEDNIQCAVRELLEETGIKKNNYLILPNVKKSWSHISYGIRYINIFYIAICTNEIKKNDEILKSLFQSNGEVNKIDWFDIEKIRLMPEIKNIESILQSSLNIAKQFWNNKWKNHEQRKKKYIDLQIIKKNDDKPVENMIENYWNYQSKKNSSIDWNWRI